MPVLLLVAQRIKIWIEPLLFRVLSIHNSAEPEPRFLRHSCHALGKLIRSKTPPTFWLPERVRHVCFVDHNQLDPVACFVLATCTNIVDLAVPRTFPSYALLTAVMTLQRLSVMIAGMLPPDGRDFTHSFFAHITHLDLLDRAAEGWDAWSGLAQLPMLTHLSFHENLIPDSVCVGALKHCKSLAVLAVVWPTHEARLATDYPYLQLDFEEPRFVMLVVADHLADWETGARGGGDYWDVADELVKQRQIQGTMYTSTFPLEIHARSRKILETVAAIESELKVLEETEDTRPAHALQIVQLRQQVDSLTQKVDVLKLSADLLTQSMPIKADKVLFDFSAA